MKQLGIGCAIVGGLVLAALILLIVAAAGYNHLVKLSQAVNSNWAQVQTVYQRRADLIPNLVATVSGAANFEKSTIVEVTQARASVGQIKVSPTQAPNSAATLAQFQQAQDHLSSALSRLLVVSERYPELRATQNFRDLQAELEGTENRIAVARRDFNLAVQAYNTAIKSFPALFYASAAGFSEKPYFQATAGAENAPKVQFNFGEPAPAAPAQAPAK